MRRDYPSETADRFLIRMPDGLRAKIKTEAERNYRSMNAEIVYRLSGLFENPETKKADAQP